MTTIRAIGGLTGRCYAVIILSTYWLLRFVGSRREMGVRSTRIQLPLRVRIATS